MTGSRKAEGAASTKTFPGSQGQGLGWGGREPVSTKQAGVQETRWLVEEPQAGFPFERYETKPAPKEECCYWACEESKRGN